MKLSAQEEYGLRCLIQIGRHEQMSGESLSISEISQFEGLSVANAGKFVRALRLGGFVDSERGHAGGYRLSRPAEQIVIGHAGVRVFPYEREVERQTFEFMNSGVSTEKPKGVAIREIAAEIFRNQATGGKTLLVGGPAIIHTGSGKHLKSQPTWRG